MVNKILFQSFDPKREGALAKRDFEGKLRLNYFFQPQCDANL